MTVFIVIVNDEVDSVWDSNILAVTRSEKLSGSRVIVRRINNG